MTILRGVNAKEMGGFPVLLVKVGMAKLPLGNGGEYVRVAAGNLNTPEHLGGEKLYTLDEARDEIARRECSVIGHSYEKIVTFQGTPTALLCERCGDGWMVVREGNTERDKLRKHLRETIELYGERLRDSSHGKDSQLFWKGAKHALDALLPRLK